jgi:hypothetical protein
MKMLIAMLAQLCVIAAGMALARSKPGSACGSNRGSTSSVATVGDCLRIARTQRIMGWPNPAPAHPRGGDLPRGAFESLSEMASSITA